MLRAKSRVYIGPDRAGLAGVVGSLRVGTCIRAATCTVTTKINEIRHGSSFSAESPTEVRLVTAYFGPSGQIGRDKPDLSVIRPKTTTRDEF